MQIIFFNKSNQNLRIFLKNKHINTYVHRKKFFQKQHGNSNENFKQKFIKKFKGKIIKKSHENSKRFF